MLPSVMFINPLLFYHTHSTPSITHAYLYKQKKVIDNWKQTIFPVGNYVTSVHWSGKSNKLYLYNNMNVIVFSNAAKQSPFKTGK
jgi:hypothetical protein